MGLLEVMLEQIFSIIALKKYDIIFDRIRHLVGLKIGVPYVNCFNYSKIKIDSDDDLSLEKTLHNVVILITSVLILIDDDTLLKDYKTIWTKIEDIKYIKLILN